jgi:hypothetical protein
VTLPVAVFNAANRFVVPCRAVVVSTFLGATEVDRQQRLGPV